MKTIILAGGKGTRISEESIIRPKPMVTIGPRPILWHIMKNYEAQGYKDFIICCGYKGEYIKKYFVNYNMQGNITCFHTGIVKRGGKIGLEPIENEKENWRVICANTGLDTFTAGRIIEVRKYLEDDSEFMITYGDGVSNVNISDLIDYHHSNGKILTISTTQPEGRFGAISIDKNGNVLNFEEKARRDQAFVNIGFMVANIRLFDYLGDGSEMLEKGPFERLVKDGQIAAYRHMGFWSPMDNIHDREYLQNLWNENPPWKNW